MIQGSRTRLDMPALLKWMVCCTMPGVVFLNLEMSVSDSSSFIVVGLANGSIWVYPG